MIYDMLDYDHSLGTTKSSKSRVRRLYGLTRNTFTTEIGKVVAIVKVEECTVYNWPTESKQSKKVTE
jgi:hypothetical protein